MTIQGGLDAIFADRPDVFVAGDLLWYPVEGDNRTRVAPDAMVILGRPKGVRGSYRQWEENNVAPQVVFEVLSPGNRFGEMLRKFEFYQKFGVLEYYIYDPGHPRDDARVANLEGWQRADAVSQFEPIENMDGWRSPRLGIIFELNSAGELRLIRPDGRPFETFVELSQRAEAAQERADIERQRAEVAREHADAAQQRADMLAARLRAAGWTLTRGPERTFPRATKFPRRFPGWRGRGCSGKHRSGRLPPAHVPSVP